MMKTSLSCCLTAGLFYLGVECAKAAFTRASVEKPFNSCMSVRKLEHLHYSAEIVWPRNTFYQDLIVLVFLSSFFRVKTVWTAYKYTFVLVNAQPYK